MPDTQLTPGINCLRLASSFSLARAFVIGRRRESLADSTLLASRRSLDRRLSRLLAIEPDTVEGRKLRRGH